MRSRSRRVIPPHSFRADPKIRNMVDRSSDSRSGVGCYPSIK